MGCRSLDDENQVPVHLGWLLFRQVANGRISRYLSCNKIKNKQAIDSEQ